MSVIRNYSKFNLVDKVGEKNSFSTIEHNIKHFLDWCFLNVGGFVNVDIPTQDMSQGNFHKLRSVNNPESSRNNTAWEAFRKDWIYETGVDYSTSPNTVSGIYINDTFYPGPTGNSTRSYYIDYSNGRITLDKPISASSKVHVDYAYRYVQTYKSSESFWWKELQRNTYQAYQFDKNPDYNILANNRVQPPFIVIETIARNQQIPLELGSYENILRQDVLLHIFTQNTNQRDSLVDTLLLQKDKSLALYDTDKLVKNDKYELNYRGEINPSGINYADIVSDSSYISRFGHISNSILSEKNTLSSSLHNAVIRWTLEINK